MSHSNFDIQRDFFNQARKENAVLNIFLNSGKRLSGKIKCFDKFTIIIETEKGEQMLFKHAISNISSRKAFGNYINFDLLKSDSGRDGSEEEEDKGEE